MKVVASIFLVLIAAIPAAAQRPKACRYVIDIEHGQVAATTDPTAACNFGGKILMTLNNLDNTKYKLEMRNFKYDSSNPSKCAAPNTPVGTPPINEPDRPGLFEFKINAEVSKTKKKPIKALGSASAECFKFDLWLYTANGTVPIHKLDPEIMITEPQPPPPPPPAPKKPGEGR